MGVVLERLYEAYRNGAGNGKAVISGVPGGATPAATSHSGVEALARGAARERGAQAAQAGHGTASATRRAYARSTRRRRGSGGRL
ncbi:hypothetical protein DL770_010681 [Monosporascus sp. CRB-9-2]|nr:hypothetical protein DL770_010681 [Monosporascus sp. CRB-9-2]